MQWERSEIRHDPDPGKVAQLNFRMQGQKGLEDAKMSLAFELVVTPNADENETFVVQSVGFYDMQAD